MKSLAHLALGGLLILGSCANTERARIPVYQQFPMQSSQLASVAIQVHRVNAMVAFYTEAFGMSFEDVNTGMPSKFATHGGITFKFVPLRASVDLEGFGLHQLGFVVDDVHEVIGLAIAHGGRAEGTVQRTEDGSLHGALRDPDGNSVEVYSQPSKR